MGEAIVGFVTSFKNEKLDERLVLQECGKNLESFMVPQRIIILEKMPKSYNGKIDKKELIKTLLEDE